MSRYTVGITENGQVFIRNNYMDTSSGKASFFLGVAGTASLIAQLNKALMALPPKLPEWDVEGD